MSDITKKALAAAVSELLWEKPLDKITVKEITDKCGLTRNAFYYHFSDVYRLLEWMLTSKADEIIANFRKEENWQRGFEMALRFLYDNKRIINNIYKFIDRGHLEGYLDKVVGAYALDLVRIHTAKSNAGEETQKLVADFYKNAFMGLVTRWVENDMKMHPKKMAKMCDIMFKGTVDQAVKSADKVIEIL